MNPNAKPEPLVIERTFTASPDRVWKAITEVEAIRKWFFDLKDFEARVGFEFEFTGQCEGRYIHHRCRITEVVPHKKLAYTWQYPGYEGSSLVTFELVADGDKTRLKLTHTGLESFPTLPMFARENFAEGWGQLIGELLAKHLQT